MAEMRGKTVLVSGGSRGIGLAIAQRCAEAGANLVLLAKTDRPHPRLPGTIHDAAAQLRTAGADVLPLVCDIRDADAVEAAVGAAAARFGGIGVLINNASAISLTSTEETPVRRYDLMAAINARGTFLVTRACLPHLRAAAPGRILTLSPPLDFAPRWFRDHPAYSLAKYSMSVLAAAWAAEYEGIVASNCLWPRTTIDTAAVRNLLGGPALAQRSRRPAVVADAAWAILQRPVGFSGWFCLDDLVLAAEGVTDFSAYAVDPNAELAPDFFVPESAPQPEDAAGAVGWRLPALGPATAPE